MHQQIRISRVPESSPRTIIPILEALAGINVQAVGGSNLELPGGEVAIGLEDDDVTAAMKALAEFHPRLVEVDVNDEEGGTLDRDVITHEAGSLLEFVRQVSDRNRRRGYAIKDILLGRGEGNDVPVQIYSTPRPRGEEEGGEPTAA